MVRIFKRKPSVDEPIRRAKLNITDDYAFRRSRTITGSASSQVVASNEDRGQLRSSRLKHHELKAHQRMLFSGLIGVVALTVLTFWLLSQLTAQIVVVAGQGAVLTPPEEASYQQLVDQYLNGRPAERFRFMLNQTGLRQYLQAKAPEVLAVSTKAGTSIPKTVFTLAFRQPLVSWQVGTTAYYVDANGVTFQKNFQANPTITVKDQSGVTLTSGEQVASNHLLAFIGQVAAGLQSSSVGPVDSVIIPPGALREIDVTLHGRAYRFKLNTDRHPAGQVADMLATITYLDKHKIVPGYVDVRVEGKAFYK